MHEKMAEEDTRLAILIAWNVVLPVCTLFGYYFGTIAVSKHIVDLQVHDMINAIPYAGFGALVGTLIGLYLTFVYPQNKIEELRMEHAVGYESHRAEPDDFSSPDQGHIVG